MALQNENKQYIDPNYNFNKSQQTEKTATEKEREFQQRNQRPM